MSALAQAVANSDAHKLCLDLRWMIRNGAASIPRNNQKRLGPSEVGHPCARKLAFGLVGVPQIGGYDDPLASLIGTAFHSWLDWAAGKANESIGRERWLAERKVVIRPGLRGTCDLYDKDTCTAIDHKVPGSTRFKAYTTKGPSWTYRGQAHLYGAGYIAAGFPVKNVAIHWIPRADARLNHTQVWMEPYNQGIVDWILNRIDGVETLIELLHLRENPAGFQQIPATPDEDCRLCPWWNPLAPGTEPLQCNGIE